MKKILLITMILSACTSKPKLEIGSCYSISLYGTHDPDDWASGSTLHEMSKFKIITIFDFEGNSHYAIQILKSDFSKGHWDLVPLYAKSKSYGYSSVKQFDKYISPNAGKFFPASETTVKCNPITDKDKKSQIFPLMKVGNEKNM